MIHFFRSVFLLLFFFYCWGNMLHGQDTTFKQLTLQEIFSLAGSASKQLDIARTNIDIAHQAKEVAEDARLPSAHTSLALSYISNAYVWGGNPHSGGTTHFESVTLPHSGTNFSVEASQLVFKGGLVKNNIEKAELQEQLAALTYQKSKADINLLLTGRYCDLMKLYNQKKVIQKHIELAQKRLANVKNMHTEGMVTKSDELRIELQITNLSLALDELNSNIAIINKQFEVVLNLPKSTYILPVKDSLAVDAVTPDVTGYIERAKQNYPDVRAAMLNKQIAEKNVNMAKAEKMPSVGVFLKNDLERPVLTVLPPIDQYFNVWVTGVSVNFDIGSLYKANKNINLARAQLKQQDNIIELQRQNIEIEVNTAFSNYFQAKARIHTLEQAGNLAEENYRIVEKKYYNQLAILADLIDASNARLDADMQLSNAHISLLYTYYQLQKAIGSLN